MEDENPSAVSKFLENTNSIADRDFIGGKRLVWFSVDVYEVCLHRPFQIDPGMSDAMQGLDKCGVE